MNKPRKGRSQTAWRYDRYAPAWSQWTHEQNFAYRLRDVLRHAFYAGTRYGAENPAAVAQFDGRAFTMDELQSIPDLRDMACHDALRDIAGELEGAFSLSEATLNAYFPQGTTPHE